MSRVLVIGFGNELRGDDGAGIAVARRLRETTGLDVSELEGEPTGLLDMLGSHDAVVLVDAMRSGAEPGTIRRIDAIQSPLPSCLSTSTHAFGLAETMELARALRRLPRTLVVYAIEGRRFEVGAPMSDAVRHGVDELTACVLGEARARTSARGSRRRPLPPLHGQASPSRPRRI